MSCLPGVRPFDQWLSANKGFFADFRTWLRQGGYQGSSLKLYSIGPRLALGLLDKAYWMIDLQADLDRVDAYLRQEVPNSATRQTYQKGLAKLAQYLALRCHRPTREPTIGWDYYLGPLPAWLAADVQAYLKHRQRVWLPETQYRRTLSAVSSLTGTLRWMAAQTPLANATDLTPALWLAYLDARLAAGIQPVSLNSELLDWQQFLRFLAEQDRPICERSLRIETLAEGTHLPKDVPPEQLARLQAEIEREAAAEHAGRRRMGFMDRAWFLLMLHSGLRLGEVCRLRLADLDCSRRYARIEQSKGLKDRLVCLSPSTILAMQAYLDVRGPANSDHVFIYRHLPLGDSYCSHRLNTYAGRCGVRVTCHQLRHSCATLLLNAGAPILTVQAILGHTRLETTLEYARLYDATVAADYYRAMTLVERELKLDNLPVPASLGSGHVLALVDALQGGTLNEAQREIVQALRSAILTLPEQEGQSLRPPVPLAAMAQAV